ncbi:hypothetical protein Thini_1042 [Thiothrix nivea DSM 5205]|uniref:Uncharacterized protein n=1 Tax=Thiothrix nivea (strain ATCC 35100 / DSM 5205 / JP2) TaxID=870187 RepID=A0A656HF55_THINJ|nr:hypothetical protein Thini_1042 [Thiothrix nivea DSM 5205]
MMLFNGVEEILRQRQAQAGRKAVTRIPRKPCIQPQPT